MPFSIFDKMTETFLGGQLTPENSYALVLSGGGTRGAYEVGVWKALKEMRIPIGGICGTSIGAMNGAFFLSQDIETIENAYLNIQMDDLFEVTDSVKRDKNLMSPENMHAMFGKFVSERGLSNRPLRELIVKYVDLKKIYDSPIEYGLVATDMNSRSALKLFKEDIPPEKLVDYILSSANYPIFKPVVKGERKMIDGGIMDNMPINMMIDRGFKRIIAVDIDGTGYLPPVQEHNAYIKRIAFTDDLGGAFEFNRDLIHRNITMGYYDALKSFRRIHGHFYYFEPGYFRKLIEEFDLQTIHGIEKAARLYGIDRYRLYKNDDFLRAVHEKHAEGKAKFSEMKQKNRTLVSSLISDPRKISELIDEKVLIYWAQDQLNTAPRFSRSWVTDLLDDYYAAAQGMIEVEYYLSNKR